MGGEGEGGTIFIQLNSQGGVFLDFLSKQAERDCIFHQFQDSKLQGTNTKAYVWLVLVYGGGGQSNHLHFSTHEQDFFLHLFARDVQRMAAAYENDNYA